MENTINAHDARALQLWKVLAAFTSIFTVLVLVAILYLPDVPLDVDDLSTLVIFFFYPIFYFLDVLSFIQLEDYGMGAIAMVFTVPVGILWVACITVLTLFGPGKWMASNGYYDVVRQGIILFGKIYFILCVAMFVGVFIGQLL